MTRTRPTDAAPGEVPPEVPPEVAERIVRAIDRTPDAVVTLVNADLTIAWLSYSATWITGTDPSGRQGADSLERIHPDDVERLIHGLAQLQAAEPQVEPVLSLEEHRPRLNQVGHNRRRAGRRSDDRALRDR